ncbi:putative F-box protein At5g55150 [Vitis vinifera]|uniref:putative F-box protein At5g55150 n=1 Tax=Vitis vinifera TaxID=29760 RepID=UPI0028830F0E|nr:putative F-box protein At5g55150 [Vitis vinifera]
MEDDGEWAWLPKDLLHSILDQLQPMEDVIRFSAACTEWRSVAVANLKSRSLHQRGVPFLMSRTKDNIGNLHSVTQKKMYKFRFPMPHNMKCCGCSLGWLIMVDVTMDVILFNPFSGNAITLPPIRRLVFEKRYALEFEDTRRLSVLQRYEYEIRLREEYGEEELEERLAFIKSGDEDWTYVDNKTSGFDYLFKTSPRVKGFRYFEDILYWKSQFYAVDRLGKLLSCEINTNFTDLRVKIVDVPKGGFGIDATSSSTFFQQLADNGGNVGWVKKKDLGDAALFLGDNHSISVRASDFTGCEPNSIYFADKEDETVWCYPGYPFDMGVYNLKHKSIARDYQLNPSQRSMPPPIWILPTFM